MLLANNNIDSFVLIIIAILGSVIVIKTVIKLISFLLSKMVRKSQKI